MTNHLFKQVSQKLDEIVINGIELFLIYTE